MAEKLPYHIEALYEPKPDGTRLGLLLEDLRNKKKISGIDADSRIAETKRTCQDVCKVYPDCHPGVNELLNNFLEIVWWGTDQIQVTGWKAGSEDCVLINEGVEITE